jgi:hypothetical protein
MRYALPLSLVAVALAAPAAGQQSPNKPDFVKSVAVPGLGVRFLDFKWDEAAYDAMMNGGSHPAARRSWVIARLMLHTDPMKWNGKTLPVGTTLLVLNPRRGADPATLHMQYVDMREVFVDMNVIAEPPPGEIYGRVPAVFETVAETLPRLAVGLDHEGKEYVLSVQYGNRKTAVTLSAY